MKFETGMKIYHPKYGDGVIRKLDSKDNEFAVLCKFNDKGNTLVWLPKKDLKVI